MTDDNFDSEVLRALDELALPAYLVSRDGRVRWQNRASVALVGDREGQSFTRLIAPEDLNLARTQFARQVIGDVPGTDLDLTVLSRDGQRVTIHASSVPFRERGEITGVFGIAWPLERASAGGISQAVAAPDLTARQREVLALLAEGLGTAEIASRLGVAEETARNHIRRLLRKLDAHSRLEAVARAYQLGILQPRSGEHN
jgi:DNA-binding CsgD family transcriptional regulator